MPIVSIEGDEKTWKTSFLYGAPLPIVGLALDPGWERAIKGEGWEMFKDADILVVPYDSKLTPQEAKKLWQGRPNGITIFVVPEPIQLGTNLKGCIEAFGFCDGVLAEALLDNEVNTAAIDTMTVLRNMAADAHLQKVQVNNPDRLQLIEIEYAKPNNAIRAIYTNYQARAKNLVVAHHLYDERQDYTDGQGKTVSKKTGKKLLHGLNGTYKHIDVALRFSKSQAGQVVTITAEYKICGYILSNEGTSFSNPTWDKLFGVLEAQLQGRIQFPRRTPV